MSPLSLLLTAKILVTFPAISLFGFGDQKRLNELTGQWGHNPMIYRLYAVALTALVVGYAAALASTLAGQFPTVMVWVGLASNFGAALMLYIWSGHPRLRAAAAIFGLIGMGLVVTILFPSYAMSAWF